VAGKGRGPWAAPFPLGTALPLALRCSGGRRLRAAGTSHRGFPGAVQPRLPPRLTRALLLPAAQRHFHLQRHTQQHRSFGFRGNHLPLANIPAATSRREGEELPREPRPSRELGRHSSGCGHAVLPCLPAQHRGCKSPGLSVACCAGLLLLLLP